MECEDNSGEVVVEGLTDQGPTKEHFETFEGPYGTINIMAVKENTAEGNATAFASLHHTIAEIMIKQARRKAAQID
ncbi:hypothetical protein ABES58_04350 [Paenibacillus lautus]|uniref:hypothetical protein n=1 Tax=Paenibacillus lautus TaxID=1401 RepID=UPI003D2AB09C